MRPKDTIQALATSATGAGRRLGLLLRRRRTFFNGIVRIGEFDGEMDAIETPGRRLQRDD
jgi:hypothetical protein